MGDNRCVRIYDLKQKVKYNPDIGTYILEEEIDEAERYFIDEDKIRSGGCEYCSGDYHQEIAATVYRFHTSSEMTQKGIVVKYCPSCGRKLS